jgi:hypothetical protein
MNPTSHRRTDEKKLCKRLRKLQASLYSEKQRSVLIVLQALDTAGKDGVINHVLGAMNPLSCRVASFKKPGPEAAAHNYLWRVSIFLPEKGLSSAAFKSAADPRTTPVASVANERRDMSADMASPRLDGAVRHTPRSHHCARGARPASVTLSSAPGLNCDTWTVMFARSGPALWRRTFIDRGLTTAN